MIQSISIENFRCFDVTEIKGFERINLITGKNNSGKTCLLEALYFSLSHDVIGTASIRDFEGEEKKGYSLMKNKEKGFISFRFGINEDLLGFKFYPQFNTFKDYETEEKFVAQNNVQLIFDNDKKYPQTLVLKIDNQNSEKYFGKSNHLNLVELFDKAQIAGLDEEVLRAVKIIDNKIIEIRTFGSYPNTLFLKKEGETTYQPISNYGDAIKKVILYVGVILNYKESLYKYLLIDEIENGIHYTAQKEVWQMLFKLCKHYNIQLFATTHSLEMIKAFEEVCEEFQNEGAYFELARHAKSNQIIGIKHQISTLEYELETNANIRGE